MGTRSQDSRRKSGVQQRTIDQIINHGATTAVEVAISRESLLARCDDGEGDLLLPADVLCISLTTIGSREAHLETLRSVRKPSGDTMHANCSQKPRSPA
jgi:hypothetical protein